MDAELSSDHSAFLDQLVASGQFVDRRQALKRAVDLLREDAETLEDIQAGLESIQRGEGIELHEAHRRLRVKHRLPDAP